MYILRITLLQFMYFVNPNCCISLLHSKVHSHKCGPVLLIYQWQFCNASLLCTPILWSNTTDQVHFIQICKSCIYLMVLRIFPWHWCYPWCWLMSENMWNVINNVCVCMCVKCGWLFILFHTSLHFNIVLTFPWTSASFVISH
jgi:hypothetical protein